MDDLVERARELVGTETKHWHTTPTFYAFPHMNDERLAAVVSEAETDPVAFEALKNWLAGPGFPNPVPEPLVPFLQELLRGRTPPPGNIKRALSHETLMRAVEVLVDEFTCEERKLKCTKSMAFEAIAKVEGVKSDTIKRAFYKRGK